MTSAQLGIGLPSMIPGIDPDLIPRWAERAEAGPFSCLATGELLTSDAYDPLVALTAAATFSILDTYIPSLAVQARSGAGFGIGANLVGFPRM